MNTITHLTAVLSSLWASIFAFQILEEPAVGGAMLILFFGFTAFTVAAVDDDVFLASGKKMMRFRSNTREPLSPASKLALAITVILFAMAVASSIWDGT